MTNVVSVVALISGTPDSSWTWGRGMHTRDSVPPERSGSTPINDMLDV